MSFLYSKVITSFYTMPYVSLTTNPHSEEAQSQCAQTALYLLSLFPFNLITSIFIFRIHPKDLAVRKSHPPRFIKTAKLVAGRREKESASHSAN